MQHQTRIYGLDILRAAAILFVMQSHSLIFFAPLDVHYYWLFILDGVDLFFVLSGFLIGHILLEQVEEQNLSFTSLLQFWKRRWLRTLPAYFLVLTLLVIGYLVAFGKMPADVASYYFFLQSFNQPHPRFFPEAWSLAVEEWFYILIPLGLFIVLRLQGIRKKQALYWIIFALVITTAFRIYQVYTHNYLEEKTWDLQIRKQVLTRLDTILYGFLGAWICRYHTTLWSAKPNLTFIIGLVVLFGSRMLGSVSDAFYQYAATSISAIGALLILPKLYSIKAGEGYLYRCIRFISLVSYSMYLLNYTVVLKILVPKFINFAGLPVNRYETRIVSYILFWSVTIILSYILYRYFEKPIMEFRNRRIPGRGASTAPIPSLATSATNT